MKLSTFSTSNVGRVLIISDHLPLAFLSLPFHTSLRLHKMNSARNWSLKWICWMFPMSRSYLTFDYPNGISNSYGRFSTYVNDWFNLHPSFKSFISLDCGKQQYQPVARNDGHMNNLSFISSVCSMDISFTIMRNQWVHIDYHLTLLSQSLLVFEHWSRIDHQSKIQLELM